jgi:ABC-2 type transport system ATP-binding protein
LAKISGKVTPEKIDETMRFVGLDPDDRKPFKTYSVGMRQRLGLAQAIMEDPDLLILDEPTAGLDFDGQREIYEYLIELRNQGKTILITSHSQGEIKLLCDKAFLLKDGKLELIPDIQVEDLSAATDGD